MIELLMNGEQFATYKDLKGFNRFSKKYLSLNFKNEISLDESDAYKIMLINYRLSNSAACKLNLLYKGE